jgi:hypothetical protein
MSLKTFHVVFIILAILMSFGVGWWSLAAYANGAGVGIAVMGAVSIAIGIALGIYGRYFLKKLRGLSYL